MLAKGQHPVIRRLSELIVSPSPRGNLKSFNAGVGLGIVAALDTSTSVVRGCEILVKHAVCSLILNSSRRPVPISIAFAGGSSFPPEEEDDELDNAEENYTYVTTFGPHENRHALDAGNPNRRREPPINPRRVGLSIFSDRVICVGKI